MKGRIQTARLQAGRAVNRELVMLYWDIGRGIVEKQQVAGWGEAVVERLAADLRAAFPQGRYRTWRYRGAIGHVALSDRPFDSDLWGGRYRTGHPQPT